MIETFYAMETALQVYWILAGVSSVIFIIQAIMTFVGFDSDADLDLADAPDEIPMSGDSDFDADGFHLISVKTIICFMLGFGWTGVLFWDSISSPLLLGGLAAIVGLLFMSIIAFLLFQMRKLDKENTFRVENVIGMNAEVYLRIPGGRKDTGKVNVSLHGSMHELEAMTEGGDLPTGAKVRITGKVDAETVMVEAL